MADDAAGAVRRTPRPYPSTGDHQTPETGAPVAPGATNPATPVSQDAGTATGDLRLYEVTLTPEIPVTGGKVVRVVSEPPGGIDQVVAEFAALPECEACGGSGKDDHASPFEAPLAVHFAGPPVEIAGRRRQLCMWCGHVLLDARLVTHAGQPPTSWPVGALVRVEDGLGTVVPHEPDAELPPGCCALPDEESAYNRADDGLCEKCVAPALNDPEGLGLHSDTNLHGKGCGVDAERQADEDGPEEDQAPTEPAFARVHRGLANIADALGTTAAEVHAGLRAYVDERLGADGPDEAQETRAAANWPPEPVNTRHDEQETDRA